MENRFNLIDEPWIPVAGAGRVSLGQIFTNSEYRRLGGNPVQKIAVMKLLLAIAQAAATPENEEEWRKLGAQGLSEKCTAYLETWHGQFFLYGEKPFLQMPAIFHAEKQPYGALLPEVSTGNTTVHTQSQVERILSHAEKALLLVTLMGFALGGKKVDNSLSLTVGYKGKTKAGKPGPAIAHMGLLHSFIYGDFLLDSLWMNLFTQKNIHSSGIFSGGVGNAPWEKMPQGEDCPVAQELKTTLMGRLIPMCRFCLLDKDGVHYSEGISHLNYLDGFFDPTIAIDCSGKKNKVLWADPEKRPWRQLPAMLSFVKQAKRRFECFQLYISMPRTRHTATSFTIWSGGLRVSSNAGEQYVSGSNDFVESEVRLKPEFISDTPWFNQLILEMEHLEGIAKKLYGSILNFYKTQLSDGGAFAGNGTNQFWQLCERDFQYLINACDDVPESAMERERLRRKFAGYVHTVYNQCCPNDTARQMDAWAKCRPNLSNYLKKEE